MHKAKQTPRQIRVPDFRSCPMIDLGRETDGNNEVCLGVRFALCIIVWNASHINIANKHGGSVYFLVHHLPCSTNTNLRNLVQSRYHLRKHNSQVLSHSGSPLIKMKASSLYSLRKCNTCQVRNKSAGWTKHKPKLFLLFFQLQLRTDIIHHAKIKWLKTKALTLSIAFGTESSAVEHTGLSHNRLHKQKKRKFLDLLFQLSNHEMLLAYSEIPLLKPTTLRRNFHPPEKTDRVQQTNNQHRHPCRILWQAFYQIGKQRPTFRLPASSETRERAFSGRWWSRQAKRQTFTDFHKTQFYWHFIRMTNQNQQKDPVGILPKLKYHGTF